MAVAAAWANGNRPTYTKGDRWILRLDGNRYATLANGPNLTAEGRYARDNLGWDEPDLSLDIFQVPEIRGASEYLRLRSGMQVRGRIWRDGKWQYTARGRVFYQHRAPIVPYHTISYL